jgi:hypothetical protein
MRSTQSILMAVPVSAALFASSAVSSAQPVPKEITAEQFEDARVIDAFAKCVVAKHPSDSANYVLNSYSDWRTAPTSTPGKLKDKGCIPAQASSQDTSLVLKLSENAIKAALAEALARREFRAFDATAIKTAKPLQSGSLVDSLFPPDACKKCGAKQKAEFEDARVKLNNLMAPIIFAECAVRTDPENAYAVIMSERASAEETASFNAMQPAFNSCLVRGLQFTTTRSVLRGLLALSHYRIAHAPRLKLAGASE